MDTVEKRRESIRQKLEEFERWLDKNDPTSVLFLATGFPCSHANRGGDPFAALGMLNHYRLVVEREIFSLERRPEKKPNPSPGKEPADG